MWTQKLDHAKRHLEALEQVLRDFLAENPYAIGQRRDHANRLLYVADRVEPIPEVFPLLAGDVIQNLRSALDQLAFSMFEHRCKRSESDCPRRIYFPIADSVEKYEETKGRKTKGIDSHLVDFIDSLRPYKGGNDCLWRIHALNLVDKHRTLVTMGGTVYEGFNAGAHTSGLMRQAFPGIEIPDLNLFLKPAVRKIPMEVGDVLFSDGPNANINPKLTFQLSIVFNEPGIVEGEPAIDVLEGPVRAVDEIAFLFAKYKL